MSCRDNISAADARRRPCLLELGSEMAQGAGQLGAVPAFLIGLCLGAVALLIGVTLVFDLKITRSFMHPGLT
ncbi:hypothetical protein [Actinacidiphila glaucinigra]|uniref:hypothetical protein n=1 Tax=Actinacidiphila glaucinigra TaxID=235986 RepID=UPI000B78566D|nr:hypothetical protein [Actinacidiphila glaucinigra]